MPKSKINAGLLIIILLTVSCGKNEVSPEAKDTNAIVSSYIATTDFTSIGTYYIPDTVLTMSTTPNSLPASSSISIEIQRFVLSEIINQMDIRGYQRILITDPSNQPDIFVFASQVNSGSGQDKAYWYNWFTGCLNADCDVYGWSKNWGVYYNDESYAILPYYSNYADGTLQLDFVSTNTSLQKIVSGDTLNSSLWSAILDGVLESSDISSSITNGINQAFTQSPYLSKTE